MVEGILDHRQDLVDRLRGGRGGAGWRQMRPRPQTRRWDVPVAESVVAPPGPIPNPVVTRCSAGEYCGGDPVGGEAAAGTSQRRGQHP